MDVLDRKIDDYNRRIVTEVKSSGTTLTRVYGVGPINAAVILGDVSRFPSRDHFASYPADRSVNVSVSTQMSASAASIRACWPGTLLHALDDCRSRFQVRQRLRCRLD